MRVLFCGSGRFAVPSLRAILETEHEVVGVVTQPARPAGRGAKLRPTPLALAAGELGQRVTAQADINSDEALEDIRRLRAEVICVIDFAQLVARRVRDAAPLGAINLHASLLPELRGAAPVNWAIIRGYRRTGVTTFSLVDRLDAGDIYAQHETGIGPGERADELRDRLAERGAALVCRTLELLASGKATVRPQDDSKATRAPRLTKADGRIDFSADAETVRNRIHGTWPWPGGQAIFQRHDGRTVPVTLARAATEPAPAGAEPGTLDEDFLIATGAGKLRIKEVQPANKRLMSWDDFINGYRLREGGRFVSVES